MLSNLPPWHPAVQALRDSQETTHASEQFDADTPDGVVIDAQSGSSPTSVRPYMPVKRWLRIIEGGSGSFPAYLYSWEEVTRDHPQADWEKTGLEGSYDDTPAAEINESTSVAINSIHEATLHQSGGWWEFDASAAADTKLAQLTAKCYYDGSDTRDVNNCPTGTGLNCDPVPACEARFITYSWSGVTSGTDPLALTYTQDGTHGSPQCNPAYHEQKIDLPTFPVPSPEARFPTSIVNDSTSGTVDWVDPENADTSNDTYATATLTSGQTTKYLKATGFCFGLAGNLTISNVTVRVEAHASADTVTDLKVELVVGGTIGGTSQHTGVDLGTTDAVRTYSATPTAWGFPSLSILDVNSADFGVALRYSNGSASSRSVSVDSIEIRLTYTPDGLVLHHAIVRMRRGHGNFWLIDQMPWVEMIRRTDTTDADGYVSYVRYWDQNAEEFRDGEEVRLIVME